ncbi:PilZ domain-containing protein [Leptospira gomenensis]|uniref:PilZ domain-containing protein n=1 Tax=Leptospira gomenensis TaxID=2484974 RepID=A0A5F1YPD3_9LEPT|nr:PilZ domain-containing protein [Leptospira gomenensis]TGK28117.1 PilZ domain-containing protein [Leptospira gomenensis]TGK37027.1 PilZ domain-containing protein [Leptospira gomenensis]TGK45663.1 PilZ domain-containing protein [Leptospira gomenensis]TGK59602.1 PilZ domain-containing protein [Leptospira gomenensis]
MQTEMGKQKKKDSDSSADKRFYKRFRKKNNLVKMVLGKNEILGNLEDISMIGASISSREEILLGQRVKFMSPILSVEIEADVIRRDLVQETYKYGLVFHDLSDAAIVEILNKIASAD